MAYYAKATSASATWITITIAAFITTTSQNNYWDF
jgi:hypothetical protein